MSTKMSDGRGLVPRDINDKHGPAVIGTTEIAVNKKKAFNFVTKHAMHHAIKSIQAMPVNSQ